LTVNKFQVWKDEIYNLRSVLSPKMEMTGWPGVFLQAEIQQGVWGSVLNVFTTKFVYCIVHIFTRETLKGALNPNFLNLAINREKFCL